MYGRNQSRNRNESRQQEFESQRSERSRNDRDRMDTDFPQWSQPSREEGYQQTYGQYGQMNEQPYDRMPGSSYSGREYSGRDENSFGSRGRMGSGSQGLSQGMSQGMNRSFDRQNEEGYGQGWEGFSPGYSQGDRDGQRASFRDQSRQDSPRFSGKGPKGYSRSDERIREDVCDALTHDDNVDASEIDVSVESGVVTLSGTVTERRMKRLAEDCIEDVRGVSDVRNELRVQSTKETTSDMDGRSQEKGSEKTSGKAESDLTGKGRTGRSSSTESTRTFSS